MRYSNANRFQFLAMAIVIGCFLIISSGHGVCVEATPPTDSNSTGVIRHPFFDVINVGGQPLTMPNRKCGNGVQRALQENREVPGYDSECTALIERALYLEHNAPPPEKLVPAVPGPTPQPSTP
jgi:hypothetical protein